MHGCHAGHHHCEDGHHGIAWYRLVSPGITWYAWYGTPLTAWYNTMDRYSIPRVVLGLLSARYLPAAPTARNPLFLALAAVGLRPSVHVLIATPWAPILGKMTLHC
jgi:hypothetical protein